MGIKVNMTGVEMKSFEPVPAGKYRAKVDDMIYTAASKRSGQPKVQFTFTLQQALDTANAAADIANRKAFYEISLQEQSLWNLKRSLVALGDNPEDLDGEIELVREDYIGRECIVVLGIEEYEGTPRQRTRRLEPLPA